MNERCQAIIKLSGQAEYRSRVHAERLILYFLCYITYYQNIQLRLIRLTACFCDCRVEGLSVEL